MFNHENSMSNKYDVPNGSESGNEYIFYSCVVPNVESLHRGFRDPVYKR